MLIDASDDFFVFCQCALEHFDAMGIESRDRNLYVDNVGHTVWTG
jgi:hypothetical protein